MSDSDTVDVTSVLGAFEAGGTPLIRTDFSSDSAWHTVVDALTRTADADELDALGAHAAHVVPIDELDFNGVSPAELALALGRHDGLWGYALLADTRSVHEAGSDEITVVYVDLTTGDPEDTALRQSFPGRSFRCPTTEVASIEANLSIANLDFDEFADGVGQDGVFRGCDDNVSPPLVIPEAETGLAASLRIGRDVDGLPGARTLSGRVGTVHVERAIAGTRRKLFELCAHLTTWSHVWMRPVSTWDWDGGPDDGIGSVDWALSHNHPDQLTGSTGAVKTIFLEIDEPHRAVREWQWMTPPQSGEARLSGFVPFLAQPTQMAVTLTQSTDAEGRARTLIQIDHDRVPVEWVDDLTTFWAYQLSIADHAGLGTRK